MTAGDRGPDVETGGGGTEPSSASGPVPPDTGPPTVLLLVRHGRTDLTEQYRFSGSGGLDAPLSPDGELDAARVAGLLAGLGGPGSPLPQVGPVTAVVSSPLRRTRQTAAAVAGPLGLPVREMPGWAEIAFGEWDGLTYAEVSDRWPGALARWRGSQTFAPPGGQSPAQLAERVRAARAETVARFPGQVVVVATHGVPIRLVVQEALEGSPWVLWRTRIDPASVTAVRYWADGGLEVSALNVLPAH